jgi:hypothetical protein
VPTLIVPEPTTKSGTGFVPFAVETLGTSGQSGQELLEWLSYLAYPLQEVERKFVDVDGLYGAWRRRPKLLFGVAWTIRRRL